MERKCNTPPGTENAPEWIRIARPRSPNLKDAAATPCPARPSRQLILSEWEKAVSQKRGAKAVSLPPLKGIRNSPHAKKSCFHDVTFGAVLGRGDAPSLIGRCEKTSKKDNEPKKGITHIDGKNTSPVPHQGRGQCDNRIMEGSPRSTAVSFNHIALRGRFLVGKGPS